MDKKIMIQMMRQGERWNKIDMKMERFLMKLKKEGMMMMMMLMEMMLMEMKMMEMKIMMMIAILILMMITMMMMTMMMLVIDINTIVKCAMIPNFYRKISYQIG
jgi:hypothetical protein